MVERLLCRLQHQHICHIGVHARRAQRPPEGNNKGPPIVDAQPLLSLLPCQREKILPHRCAGDHYLIRVLVVLSTAFKAHHNAVGKGLQQLRGQPRHGVGFMHRRRNTLLGGGLYHGIAGIAACSNDHIRLKISDDLIRPAAAGKHIVKRFYIMDDPLRCQLSLEIGDLHGFQPKSCPGHQIRLHAVLCPHEQNICIRIPFPNQTCHSQRRADVPSGATAGKDHIHIIHNLISFYRDLTARCPCIYRNPAEHCLDAPRMIPISPSWISSAVPP